MTEWGGWARWGVESEREESKKVAYRGGGHANEIVFSGFRQ